MLLNIAYAHSNTFSLKSGFALDFLFGVFYARISKTKFASCCPLLMAAGRLNVNVPKSNSGLINHWDIPAGRWSSSRQSVSRCGHSTK